MAASKNIVMAAEGYGKHKTISQMVCISALLVLESYAEWGAIGEQIFGAWVAWFGWVALWITVFLTAMSGALYLWNNREIYINDV
jgi:phosphatidylglycerophosphate synthase